MARKIFLSIFLVIVLVLLGLYAFTHFRVQQINQDIPPAGDFISVDNINLHYTREGSGSPVVLLHGRDGALQEYTFSIFDQLAEENDVIAFDRPGYGHSEWPEDKELSLEVQARLINKALKKLNIENPLLVGHSYGGAVVLQYLLNYQKEVSGAVLLAPASYMDEPPDGSLYSFPNIPVLGPLLTHTILLPVGERIAPNIYEQSFYPEQAPENYVNTMTALYLRPSNFTATAGELSVMKESLQAISPHYEEITVPVTVLFGTSDKMVDLETDGRRLVEDLPNGELTEIEGAGHKLHHTHSDLVIEAINDVSGF